MSILNKISKTTLVVSSGLVGLIVAALPGEAATFATSNSFFSFGNFSQTPASVSSSTDSDTTSISSGAGSVLTEAEASAFFDRDPAFSGNTTVSEAFGEGLNYLGLAESEASVLGQFEVAANTNFTFDFTGFLELFTSIDDPLSEQAQATAGITFALLDEAATVLSSFELFGTLSTSGKADDLFVESTPDLDWDITDAEFVSGPDLLAEQAFVEVFGSYAQQFTTAQQLTLVELKLSEAFVAAEPAAQTPEPSTLLAVISLGGAAWKLRNNKSRAAKPVGRSGLDTVTERLA